MSRQEVYEIERAKWDRLAELRGRNLEVQAGEDFHTWARKSLVMTGISEFLGDLRGKKVLDFGCGLGMTSTLLARSGAKVTSFDLSPMSAFLTRRRAEVAQVAPSLRVAVAAGERLPFADGSFDIVFGKAILHHLDASVGASELARVLKPGGKAAFSEPMGMNPVLSFVRDHVPYPGKTPRGADIPLSYRDIYQWCAPFEHFSFKEVQLLSMIERGLGHDKELRTLRRVDNALLSAVPPLRRFCRYVVILMQKGNA